MPRHRELRRGPVAPVALWGRRGFGAPPREAALHPPPLLQRALRVPVRPGRLAARRGLS